MKKSITVIAWAKILAKVPSTDFCDSVKKKIIIKILFKKKDSINLLSHLCFPYFDPTKLATVSPTPTDKTPDERAKKSNPAEPVISEGFGWIHKGNEHPIKR